jgi:hypothetical protein
MLAFLLAVVLISEPFVVATGTVKDSQGAMIPRARVTYHRNIGGEFYENGKICDGTVETDQSGKFNAQVHPGVYDVCVISDSFTPQCRKVDLRGKKPFFPDFVLRVDPLATGHRLGGF